MQKLNPKELREFIQHATFEEIVEYWKQVTAPEYGYKRLVNPVTGEIIAEI